MKGKPLSIILLAGFLALGLTTIDLGAAGSKIKKCKDAQGKWHYGDRAAEECARSRVMELSDEGVTTKVIDAPLTKDEVRQRDEQQALAEEERRQAAEQARRDRQLLQTYGHEDDIIYIRDRKLTQINYTITATTRTLRPLRDTLERMEAEAGKVQSKGKPIPKDMVADIERTRAQIARHEAAMRGMRREQDAIKQQAAEDLKRYRELKQDQARGAPPK
ncbi:MAG: hypothetical protein ACE5K1_04525 [Acidiferrobacterales bacterium]